MRTWVKWDTCTATQLHASEQTLDGGDLQSVHLRAKALALIGS
jgi:hypothetical protein